MTKILTIPLMVLLIFLVVGCIGTKKTILTPPPTIPKVTVIELPDKGFGFNYHDAKAILEYLRSSRTWMEEAYINAR